ncbi:MAG: DNA polymerase III subunit gamma/tau [Pirellulales bacterium]|nr:DNA polymerase III subunit gamma/tau [Pirellulales bacterium]
MSDSPSNPPPPAGPSRADYVVVARRYRPQVFEDLIGQEHVARALSNAIATNRVGHAYLFTGARGVGKTSAARIFAKALNCQSGPGAVPCNRCEICQSISSGDDVDVLEIDGASNRGIDEIRQLRQNVNIRPSRARLKIYIIDEVHMLTREAFNALLKTLEEPPEHVKFFFCTTDPNKIPVTILSRCQRFDFAGIQTGSIAARLGQIVAAEGVSAEPEALEVLARRAAGSMRDGQSLLEQLLAFAPERIALADVHGMLGTAGETRLAQLVARLAARDVAGALTELDAALIEGVDVGLLLEQLFGYLRDCMAAVVGCPGDMLLYASPGSRDQVAATGKQLGLHTLLAMMQILDHALARIRQSTQARILAELAIARICTLEDLDELPALIARLEGRAASASPSTRPMPVGPGHAAAASAASADRPASADPTAGAGPGDVPPDAPPHAGAVLALTPETATEVWSRVAAQCPGLVGENAKQFDRVATPAPNRLVVFFKPGYTFQKSACQRPERVAQFQQRLAQVTGQNVTVEFRLDGPEPSDAEPTSARPRPANPSQRLLEVAEHPLVRRAGELFGAEPTRVTEPPKRPPT